MRGDDLGDSRFRGNDERGGNDEGGGNDGLFFAKYQKRAAAVFFKGVFLA
ncbi:MAG: hypothetical protein ACR2P4_10280 [Gammaproteobacteria bacterium]